MRRVTALVSVGFAVMLGAILYGIGTADFLEEGRALWSLVWGKITLLEVYLGFALFSGWVVFRERSMPQRVLWVFLILTFGNVVSCLYALRALRQSRGVWPVFWLGRERAVNLDDQ